MPPGPRVLIVDDEENQRRTLAIGLRIDGFDVCTASSAAEALSILAESRTDFMLVDMMMPGINGLDLARQVRRLFPSVKVVLISAYHLSENQLRRADCGVVGFVPKPFQMRELVAFLQSKSSL
jgi:DNA-binding response OmpR family regulator